MPFEYRAFQVVLKSPNGPLLVYIQQKRHLYNAHGHFSSVFLVGLGQVVLDINHLC